MSKKAKNDHDLWSLGMMTSSGSEPTSQVGRPAGIKDIAKALGISIGTVDRAIHSRGGINPITKERVLKMAQTLRYKPNLAARYLESTTPGPRSYQSSCQDRIIL